MSVTKYRQFASRYEHGAEWCKKTRTSLMYKDRPGFLSFFFLQGEGEPWNQAKFSGLSGSNPFKYTFVYVLEFHFFLDWQTTTVFKQALCRVHSSLAQPAYFARKGSGTRSTGGLITLKYILCFEKWSCWIDKWNVPETFSQDTARTSQSMHTDHTYFNEDWMIVNFSQWSHTQFK